MAPKTILLKGDATIKEAEAEAAITPGHLIEKIAAGTVQKQATTALNSPMLIALEDSLVGGEIDTDYDDGDRVYYAAAKKGEEYYVWLSDGETVVIGDELEVGSTDGEFIKRSSGISVATAEEAVDLSNSANTTKGRLKISIN